MIVQKFYLKIVHALTTLFKVDLSIKCEEIRKLIYFDSLIYNIQIYFYSQQDSLFIYIFKPNNCIL